MNYVIMCISLRLRPVKWFTNELDKRVIGFCNRGMLSLSLLVNVIGACENKVKRSFLLCLFFLVLFWYRSDRVVHLIENKNFTSVNYFDWPKSLSCS